MVHNMAQKEQGSTGRKINSFMYKHCSVTPVALSNEVRRSIQQVYGLPEKQIPAIYNGIDLSKCSPKETYDIKDCYTFLHVGRFMEVKNHETLIRAFAKIAAAHENVKLQLIGEGELRTLQMEELVKSLKIKSKVDFLGLQQMSTHFYMMRIHFAFRQSMRDSDDTYRSHGNRAAYYFPGGWWNS